MAHHRRVGILGRVGAGLGVGLGAGSLGIGWYYSSLVLDTSRRPVFPERVLAADGDRIVLAQNRLTLQPGVWGLRWEHGLAVLGPVAATRRGEVIRPLLDGPVPPPGTAVVLDAGPFDPDPGARGLAFHDVDVPGPLGPYPAWFVPAGGDTWVVMVHGRGGSRREGLRVLPALHERGHPVLVVSYRNDEGAPASADGHDHLGDTEWVDVEAAVRHALGNGARRIVLFGWSMGGALTGAFLDRSPEASAVAAVVWDAPLVDWRATLRQQARNRRLPPGADAARDRGHRRGGSASTSTGSTCGATRPPSGRRPCSCTARRTRRCPSRPAGLWPPRLRASAGRCATSRCRRWSTPPRGTPTRPPTSGP